MGPENGSRLINRPSRFVEALWDRRVVAQRGWVAARRSPHRMLRRAVGLTGRSGRRTV